MIYQHINLHPYLGSTDVNCLSNSLCNTSLPNVNAGTPELASILQIVFGILAALSVLFIVIGGLRFVLSEGNPESTSKARNTILYAVIGLAIALSAEALVAFVLGKL